MCAGCVRCASRSHGQGAVYWEQLACTTEVLTAITNRSGLKSGPRVCLCANGYRGAPGSLTSEWVVFRRVRSGVGKE